MSTTLLMFFVFATLCAAILDGVLGGSNGIATASLTSTLSETAVTANVDDTSALGKSGVVLIEGEVICFTGNTTTTLTGLKRGQRCEEGAKIESPVAAHPAGARVYNEASGLLNAILDINVASNFSEGGFVGQIRGVVKTVAAAPQFIAILARMIMWDFTFLTGPYVYVKVLILGALSAGLVLGGIKLALGR